MPSPLCALRTSHTCSGRHQGGESKPTGPAAAADGGGQVAPRPSEGGGGGAGDAGAGGSALDEHRSGAPLDTNPPPSISSQDTQAKAALVSEMKDLRAKYQELLNYTISLDADMKRAQAGEVGGVEFRFPSVRLP